MKIKILHGVISFRASLIIRDLHLKITFLLEKLERFLLLNGIRVHMLHNADYYRYLNSILLLALESSICNSFIDLKLSQTLRRVLHWRITQFYVLNILRNNIVINYVKYR